MPKINYKKYPILFIDDDKEICNDFQQHYSKTFTVLTAISGDEGMAVLKKENKIILVIADQYMPRMRGLEVLKKIKTDHPQIIGILATSFPDIDVLIEAINKGLIYRYVRKPWNTTELELEIKNGIERYIYEQETKLLHKVLIDGFSKLADLKDKETGDHLVRIKHYVEVLAKELRNYPQYKKILDNEYIQMLKNLSPLHDIGKVGIPDIILLKPGKLTSEEKEIMKKHTIIGGDTLAVETELQESMFLKMSSEIAYYHHERWDGKGYPTGLKGEKIPIPARIVALADIYDAVVSTRPYDKPRDHEVAISEIEKSSGTALDPIVVQAFFRVANKFKEIRKKFAEKIPDNYYQNVYKMYAKLADEARKTSEDSNK